MFGKLKNKLKDWTSKVADAEEEVKELEEIEESKDKEEGQNEKVKKKGFFKKMFSKKNDETPEEKYIEETNDDKNLEKETKTNKKDTQTKEEKKIEPKKPKEDTKEKVDKKEEPEPIPEEGPKKKKSIFSKLTSSKKTITEEEYEEHSEDLEMILLENNVALEVTEKILEELKEEIVGIELSKKEIIEKITNLLSEKIKEVLIEPFNIEKEMKEKNGPYVILFCGINGTGKTTTISKIANMFKEKGKSVVMAAGDTFRAAAVEQLKTHGEKLDIKVIAHDYGADPASVGFDAIKYAEKNNIDLVLIDTAGRIHTATNLIREMEKIKRVCKPDRTLFVGEAICGNDAVDQVKAFNENIGIDGIVLSKSDIDEKGGTALSLGYTTKKPIIFLGTGQNYKDIEFFDKQKFLEKLELE